MLALGTLWGAQAAQAGEFAIPSGDVAKVSGVTFSGCSGSKYGYQLDQRAPQEIAHFLGGCKEEKAANAAIGPFGEQHTLRLYFTDTHCNFTFYSDGSEVAEGISASSGEHVKVEGESNPFTVIFWDGGVSCEYFPGQKDPDKELFPEGNQKATVLIGAELSEDYVSCAAEKGLCAISEPADVAYGVKGAGRRLVFKYDVATPVKCENGEFGGDPDEGIPKSCWRKTLPPQGGFPWWFGGYTWCSVEGATCSPGQAADLAYDSAGGEVLYLYDVAVPVMCLDEAFGGNPFFNHQKDCFEKPLSAPAGYTWCAVEGKSCPLTGPSDVAYGVGGRFRFSYGINGIASLECSNSTFGGDPAEQLQKDCYVRAAASAAVLPPVNTGPPVIAGSPVRGQSLTVSPGTWENAPSSFTYQWQSCDTSGNNCANIAGATGAARALTGADVGHELRAVVTASNARGAASARSGPSAVVGSRIEATMTWEFNAKRTYTLVEELVLHGLIRGETIRIACRGGGCPFGSRAEASATHRCRSKHKCAPKRPAFRSEVSLTHFFKGRHLRPRSRLSVQIVKRGWVGKSYTFTMRPGTGPRKQIACLAPGSSSPGAGC